MSHLTKWLGAVGALASLCLSASSMAAAPTGYSCGDGLQGSLYDLNGTTYPNTSPSFSLFDNVTPKDTAVAVPDFTWSNDPNPPFAKDDSTHVDHFADQWVGGFVAPAAGSYVFSITGDDGVALWVSSKPINPRAPGAPTPVYKDSGGTPAATTSNPWIDQGATTYDTAPMDLKAGDFVYIVFDHYENGGGAQATLMVNAADFNKKDLCAPTTTPPSITGAPGAVKDLAVSAPTSSGATLAFTEPAAADGSMVAALDIRYSHVPITPANFSLATPISSAAYPAGPGTKRTVVVTGLNNMDNYYFALEAIDGSYPTANVGALSNVVSAQTIISTKALPSVTVGQPGVTAYYYAFAAAKTSPDRLGYAFTIDNFIETRAEDQIAFEWGNGGPDDPDASGAPAGGVPDDAFGARFCAQLKVPQDGSYVLSLVSDDGSRLWFSDSPVSMVNPDPATLIVDQWVDQGSTTKNAAAMTLSKSKTYYVMVEYYENGGGALCHLQWTGPGTGDHDDIPTSALTTDRFDDNSLGRIGGILQDASGAPEAGDNVTFTVNGKTSTATTDATGYFTTLVPPGAGTISLTAPNFIPGQPAANFTAKTNQFNNAGVLTGAYVSFFPDPVDTKASDDFSAAKLNSFWTDQDLGSPTNAGDSKVASKILTIDAGGDDIWNASDNGHMIYQTYTGDFTATVKADSVPLTNVWSKAGVDVRQSADGGSIHAFMSTTNDEGYAFQGRDVTGDSSSTWNSNTGGAFSPGYVRIDRKGNVFNGFYSPDGKAVHFAGTHTVPGLTDSKIILALSVTAHDDTMIGPATFEDFRVGGTPVTASVTPTVTLGDINGDGKVNVSDATLSLRIAVGLLTPTDAQKTADDVNKDGKLSVSDTTLILQVAVGVKNGF